MGLFSESVKRAQQIVERAREKSIWEYSDAETSVLFYPKRTYSVSFPVKTKRGLEIFQGWRVQYNDALGPTKGGIRYHENTDLDEVTSLAFWMMLKNSLLGLPYGGGKGGIRFNPKLYTDEDIEKISRAWVRHMAPYLGEHRDIPAPDVYTNPKIMGWMLDEYERVTGIHAPGTFTGKPLELGGIPLREDATARGGFYVLMEAVSTLKLKKKTAVIEGFGNAGSFMAKFLAEAGVSVVGVSDSKGAVYDKRGLDVDKLLRVKQEKGTVTAYDPRLVVDSESLYEIECDIFVPAALENTLTKKRAEKMNTRIIVELANGPTTLEADTVFAERNIVVLPDILANAGGVTVSYYEWAQNVQGHPWTMEETVARLDRAMRERFRMLHETYVVKHRFTYREAAYIAAMKRVLAAEKARGSI